MSQAKGPWTVGKPTEFGHSNANMVFDANGDGVAEVYGLPQHAKLESFYCEPRYAEPLAKAYVIAASPDLLQALEAVEKLFASPGYYIGTREGADPLAIDATMLLVAQAVRAAKGEQ